MKMEDIEKIRARNNMLESNQILLANKIKKQKEVIKKLEKIVKMQDLEIQRLTNGTQQKLF